VSIAKTNAESRREMDGQNVHDNWTTVVLKGPKIYMVKVYKDVL